MYTGHSEVAACNDRAISILEHIDLAEIGRHVWHAGDFDTWLLSFMSWMHTPPPLGVRNYLRRGA